MAIQCYQCDSNEDQTCRSGEGFDTTVNAVVDCNSFEAHVPGQFCMKIYQESPGCEWDNESNVCFTEARKARKFTQAILSAACLYETGF